MDHYISRGIQHKRNVIDWACLVLEAAQKIEEEAGKKLQTAETIK